LVEDKDRSLWLATEKGLIHCDKKGIIRKFLIDKDSTSDRNFISSIEKDDNGRLWLATRHGLYYFDPALNKIMAYPYENNRSSDSLTDNVIVVKKTKGSNLWLGTVAGLRLLDLKTGRMISYKNDPKDSGSINYDVVYSIFDEDSQWLWAGTTLGLDRLDQRTGRFKHYLIQMIVYDIRKDSAGILWACTSLGLFKYDKNDDIFKPFVDPSGIMSSFSPVFGIAEDVHHGLVINFSKGILWINKDKTESRLFGKNQGVDVSSITNLLTPMQNGDVVAGDTAGFYSLNSAAFELDHSHPIASVSGFLVNDVAVEPSPNGILSAPLADSTEIRLKHDQNTFSFLISNIDFVSNHKDIHLNYMMENYDKNWRISQDGMEVYYFNIPPGKYVFRVKALGANGHFDEKQIPVLISPPWWTTWWVYTFYVLCLVAGIFLIDRIQRKVVIEKERKSKRKRISSGKRN
jgi:ligand-binding sensor domain-containing protein